MSATTVTTAPAVTTREVAQEARAFARQTGVQVGTRGRLSEALFVAYFLSQPQRARQVAEAVGIPVARRGRVASSTLHAVAAAVR